MEYLACRGNGEQFQQFIAEDGGDLTHPEEFLDVLEALTNDNYYQQIKAEVKKNLQRGGKINMCYFVEMMENIGIEKGMVQGAEKCRNALNTLIERLMADGRNDELLQSTQDHELQKRLMNEYGIQDLES